MSEQTPEELLAAWELRVHQNKQVLSDFEEENRSFFIEYEALQELATEPCPVERCGVCRKPFIPNPLPKKNLVDEKYFCVDCRNRYMYAHYEMPLSVPMPCTLKPSTMRD